MTTLERFLVKKPADLSVEKKTSESLKLEPSNDLVSTIKHLKSIFPAEPEETLMLLALQHQNPRDLETVVQKMLEEGSSFNSFSGSWNTIKSRDKNKINFTSNKPRKLNQRKTLENKQERREKPEKTTFSGKNNRNELVEKDARTEFRHNDRENLKKYKIKSQKVEKVEESLEKTEKSYENSEKYPKNIEKNPEKAKNIEKNPEKAENNANDDSSLHLQVEAAFQSKPNPSLPKLWSEISVTPPQEINENSEIPPQTIPASVPCSIFGTSEGKIKPQELEKPSASSKSLPITESKTEKASIQAKTQKKAETRDVGVQVELLGGVAVIVYPYMFHRSN